MLDPVAGDREKAAEAVASVMLKVKSRVVRASIGRILLTTLSYSSAGLTSKRLCTARFLALVL